MPKTVAELLQQGIATRIEAIASGIGPEMIGPIVEVGNAALERSNIEDVDLVIAMVALSVMNGFLPAFDQRPTNPPLGMMKLHVQRFEQTLAIYRSLVELQEGVVAELRARIEAETAGAPN